jgi:integrase
MPLKVHRRGKVWHYRGTVAGRRLRGSCQTEDKATAEREAAKIEEREWKCRHDGPAAVLTFAGAAMMYRAAGKSTRFLDRIEDHWKDTLVKDIKPSMVRQMALSLYPDAVNASRNRQGIVPCQAIINFAADAELCPHIRVKRFKENKKIKPPFTLEWVERFCEHATPHLGALCLFMFATGARVGEALAVQWDDVDLSRKQVLIRATKIGEERIAHIPPRLVVAIANLPRMEGRPVFFYRNRDSCQYKWDSIVRRAGIKRMTFHSGRHGFATKILQEHIDPKTAAWLGGWKSMRYFMDTYAHAIHDTSLNERIFDTNLTQRKSAKARVSRKTKAS